MKSFEVRGRYLSRRTGTLRPACLRKERGVWNAKPASRAAPWKGQGAVQIHGPQNRPPGQLDRPSPGPQRGPGAGRGRSVEATEKRRDIPAVFLIPHRPPAAPKGRGRIPAQSAALRPGPEKPGRRLYFSIRNPPQGRLFSRSPAPEAGLKRTFSILFNRGLKIGLLKTLDKFPEI